MARFYLALECEVDEGVVYVSHDAAAKARSDLWVRTGRVATIVREGARYCDVCLMFTSRVEGKCGWCLKLAKGGL